MEVSMNKIIKFLVNGFAVYATAYLLSGVEVSSFVVALIVAVVIAVLNVFIKPILVVLSLPVTILTLGLFTFVIDALIVLLASRIVPGFIVDGFWTAIIFSIVLTIISYVLNELIE
jgi:putative membrane protein